MSHHGTSAPVDPNRLALERMLEAMNRHDWEAAVADIADGFVQEWPQSGERITGREHCLVIYRNYPGGGPTIEVRRITGGGDHWTVESMLDYAGVPTHGVSIFDFDAGKLVRQVDYFADPFAPPAWRSQWVILD